MRTPHLSVIVLLSFPPAVLVASPAVAPFAKLRLAFEPRESGPRQHYVARAGGYSIALQGGNATLSGGASNIQMRFAGARIVAGTAGEELPGKINSVHGSDSKQWEIGLPTYASVTYREIYPGIDVVYRGNRGQMEFDLLLKPRADAGRIRLRFTGAQHLSVDADGALLVHHSQGDLRMPVPTIYQDIHGVRKPVQGRYALLPNSEVAFHLDAYDCSEPLVIDPTIVYTYFWVAAQDPHSLRQLR
jgi:hypothetical protein